MRQPSSKKQVLFHRDFRRFTGGDLKVWDYFNHVLASPGHTARIRFTERSAWDDGNPWAAAREYVVPTAEEVKPDVLFLSGVDWRQLDPTERQDSEVPIINLVQHVKHALPNDPLGRYRFLPHKAIRICVAPEVTEALERTERVRGPIFTIPDAIDVEALTSREPVTTREVDLLVVANKQPELGRSIAAQLAGTRVIDGRVPRAELLDRIAHAGVTVFVPNPKEGFYLPALEGMALGTVVVCPDCIGNRSFCVDGVNSFRPAYDEQAIVAAAREALERRDTLAGMLERAGETAREHDLHRERTAFLEILERVDELWAGA